MKNRHEFALYASALPIVAEIGQQIVLEGEQLAHRMQHIIRLKIGDELVLFNRTYSAHVAVQQISKKNVLVQVLVVKEHQPLAPAVHWFLPILEREAFETAITHLTVMGATSIQPIITEKSSRYIPALDRLQRLMIAASEQSKQFVLPLLYEPIAFNSIKNFSKMIFFDSTGEHAYQVMSEIRTQPHEGIRCMVGPEGDLVTFEKEHLRHQGVQFCALTPTVLRACDAVAVAMGLIRSLI